MKTKMHSNKDHSLGFGLLIITVGLGLLLRTMDLFSPEVERVLFHWPMLFVLIGGYQLLKSGDRTTGLIFLAIGVFFTLPRIEGFPLDFHQYFWPSLLIIIGLLVLFKGKKVKHFHHVEFEKSQADENFIVDTNVFGGSERIITSKALKGGKFTCIFGGSELNFSQAELTNEPVVIEVFYLFGGSTLLVPSDWKIHVDVVNIFGGFSQKNSRQGIEDPSKQVFIKGTVLFGGGEIKRI